MATPRRSRRATRTLGVSLLAPALVVAGLLVALPPAVAGTDDRTLPSADDVAVAEAAVAEQARTVAAVRTDLVLADQRLRTSSIAAAQAAEAFNTARWQLSLARRAAREADLAQQAALDAVDRQRAAYESTLASTYQMSPELTALSAIVRSDGIATVVDRATTLTNAEQAMDEQVRRLPGRLDRCRRRRRPGHRGPGGRGGPARADPRQQGRGPGRRGGGR